LKLIWVWHLCQKRFEDIIDIETIPIGDVDTISVDEVNSKMLSMVVEYCKKHDKRQKYVDIKDWDAQFVDVDPRTLDDLQTYGRYLKIERLGDLAFYKEFDLIKDKTPEELVQFYAAQEDSNFKSLEEKRTTRRVFRFCNMLLKSLGKCKLLFTFTQ